MQKSLFALSVSFLLGIFFPLTCHAWNAVGHILVARIAYDQLKPDVRTKVDKIVQDLAYEYPKIINFTQIASWPDELRAQKIESFTHWHYINNAFSDDNTPVKNINDTDNVVWAIGEIEPVVKNNKANSFERARFIAFLVHLVGDIHQPLHTVSRITAAHPEGDKGGNLFVIKLLANRAQTTNLHAIWDNGLGLFDGELNAENMNRLEDEITTLYSPQFFGEEINDLNPQDWAVEGMKLSTTFVYNTSENQYPNTEYISTGQQIVKQKIALAGYRLAALLNQLLA